ncbi:hypothetical protein [Thiovibrio frasassiensis]|uniref:Uncharacterized protein n=1 Tax=Thiovibrio frasassiensis TaxID=2984131 RepID=A0A9X4MD55_9BACT|nr:hypothetical protein [Thiovibrio frasassiensis]MDG4475409.1 hypothetical protein [Thiovibrio frasassiensis]
MAHKSFSKRVLVAVTDRAASAPEGQATVSDISDAMMIQTTADHKRMLNTLSDLKNAGRIVRVSQGVYAPAKRESQPEIREVMWRVLRMRRRVTVDDLVEMAGAGAEYASDWLRMLEVRAVVRKINPGGGKPCVWQMINDTVEMPVDTDSAAKHRALRIKKKQQALADLAAAQKLIGKAHQAITELED